MDLNAQPPQPEQTTLPPTPSVSDRRSFGKTASIFVSGNLIANALRLVAGFITTKLSPPAILGLFNSINTLGISYTTFLQLGIINGINREIPFYSGKGQIDKVKELSAVAQAWTIAVGGFVSIGMIGIGLYYLIVGRMDLAVGWLSNAVCAFIYFYAQLYLTMTFRTSNDFAKLAIIQVIMNTSFLVGNILVYYYLFYGLCVRALLVGFIQLGITYYWRPIRVRPKWDSKDFVHLLKIGVPIFATEILFEWWNKTIYGSIILFFTSVEDYGKFSLAFNIWTTLYITQWVQQMLFPRMAERFGKNAKTNDIIRMGLKVVPYMLLITLPIVVIGWVTLPPFVKWLLPKYVDAVPASQWTLIIILVTSFQPIVNIFNIVKRQDMYITAIIVGMVTTYLSIYLMAQTKVTLVIFPIGMIYGRIAYLIVCYYFVWRLYRKEKESALIPAG